MQQKTRQASELHGRTRALSHQQESSRQSRSRSRRGRRVAKEAGVVVCATITLVAGDPIGGVSAASCGFCACPILRAACCCAVFTCLAMLEVDWRSRTRKVCTPKAKLPCVRPRVDPGPSLSASARIVVYTVSFRTESVLKPSTKSTKLARAMPARWLDSTPCGGHPVYIFAHEGSTHICISRSRQLIHTALCAQIVSRICNICGP